MKKVLTLTSVLALAACGNDVAKYDVNFTGCERVDTTKTHLVYKCPADMERFVSVKTMTADSMFQEGGALVWDEVNADTANVYVEVVLGGDNECRVMVKPTNGEEMYAVITPCETPAPAAEEQKTEETAK